MKPVPSAILITALLVISLHSVSASAYGQTSDLYLHYVDLAHGCVVVIQPYAQVAFNSGYSSTDPTYGTNASSIQFNLHSSNGYFLQAIVFTQSDGTRTFSVEEWAGGTLVWSSGANMDTHSFVNKDVLYFVYSDYTQTMHLDVYYNDIFSTSFNIALSSSYPVHPDTEVLQFLGYGNGATATFSHLNATVTEGRNPISGTNPLLQYASEPSTPNPHPPCTASQSGEGSNAYDTLTSTTSDYIVYRTY